MLKKEEEKTKQKKEKKTKLKQQKEQQDLIKSSRVVGLHHTIFAFCFTFSWIHELLILSQHVALNSVQFKNFNHPTRGNFVVVRVGS